MSKVITGFNSEVTFNGVTFHIQTEDRGEKAGRIDTIIYKSGGAVVHRKQIFYTDIIGCECLTEVVRELMKDVHNKTINEVRKGLWSIGKEIVPDKSFMEVVKRYLLEPRGATRLG